MIRILGISGSLRAASLNTALLRAAQPLAAPDAELDIATLHGIPLYDADLESRDGSPRAVEDLKARVLASDALLIATPEYNNAMPGVLKNAIDWLSRPPADMARVFAGRPLATIGASPGGFGTILSQTSWLAVFKYLGVRQWSGGRLMVSRAGQAFDANGELTDEVVRKQLADFMHGFVQFAKAARGSVPD
jgi:chromate reductase, NAD(P)H dehydrogenase (quinone)